MAHGILICIKVGKWKEYRFVTLNFCINLKKKMNYRRFNLLYKILAFKFRGHFIWYLKVFSSSIFDYCSKNNKTHVHWWIMYVHCFFVFDASTHFKGWADLRQSCSRWWAILVIMSFIKVVLRTKEISILNVTWKENWSVHCPFSGSITIPWRDVVSYRRLSGFIVYVIK